MPEEEEDTFYKTLDELTAQYAILGAMYAAIDRLEDEPDMGEE